MNLSISGVREQYGDFRCENGGEAATRALSQFAKRNLDRLRMVVSTDELRRTTQEDECYKSNEEDLSIPSCSGEWPEFFGELW